MTLLFFLLHINFCNSVPRHITYIFNTYLNTVSHRMYLYYQVFQPKLDRALLKYVKQEQQGTIVAMYIPNVVNALVGHIKNLRVKQPAIMYLKDIFLMMVRSRFLHKRQVFFQLKPLMSAYSALMQKAVYVRSWLACFMSAQ